MGAPPSKGVTSTVQPCAESGLHRTPTFVRARPGSVDDDASAPPPHDSSPAARKSETGKAVVTVLKRPPGVSLNVSDQAFTGESLLRWYRKTPMPSTAAGAGMTATPRVGSVNGTLASVEPPARKSMEQVAAATLET